MYFSLESSHSKTLDLIVIPAISIVARFNDALICAPERWGSFVEINNTKFTRGRAPRGILNFLFEADPEAG